jgi:hypothetical protein
MTALSFFEHALAVLGAFSAASYVHWFFAGLPYVGYREWRAGR